jgi:phage terminase small subunit
MRPPKHLSAESRKLFREIAAAVELDAQAATLLQGALEQWDRAQAARAQVTAEGLMLDGKRHPLIEVEKAAYRGALAYFRELGLDPPNPVGRPSTSL